MAIDRREVERTLDGLPLGRDPAAVRRRIEAMEGLLERAVGVPGTRYRIGLDSIVGLVPVLGDVVTAAMGAWLIWEARNLGMSKWHLLRMSGNVAVDTALGFVPGLGDAFDFLFRSNTRNVKIVKRWLDRHHPGTGTIEATATDRRLL